MSKKHHNREMVAAEAPVEASVEVPVEEQNAVQTPETTPVVPELKESVSESAQEPAQAEEESKPEAISPKEKVMSSELVNETGTENVFARRRSLAAANSEPGTTVTGSRLVVLFEAYNKRMAVKTNDPTELKARVQMLKDLVAVACPMTQVDMPTATDIVRVVFDQFMNNWGTIYTDSSLFKMGRSLNGTGFELDRFVMFVEAFVQMVEAVADKKKVMFDDTRLNKTIRNPNIVIAMGRIRDNINKRNGFVA